MSAPIWWSQKGCKMNLTAESQKGLAGFVEIASTAAKIHIRKREAKEGWSVRWLLRAEAIRAGVLVLTTDQLLCAFGLADDLMSPEGRRLAAQLQATCAEPTLYRREGDYLSIPDGNPYMVSVKLDDAIAAAVTNLIRCS